jgi:hypothetical protein
MIRSVIDLESNPKTQPWHIKGWEGGLETLDAFSTHLTPERSTTSSPLFWLDPIYATIVTPSPQHPINTKVRQAGRRPFTFREG